MTCRARAAGALDDSFAPSRTCVRRTTWVSRARACSFRSRSPRSSAGLGATWAGLRWDAQAQAFNLAGPPAPDVPAVDGTAALLATDVRGLPVVPVLSLKASW